LHESHGGRQAASPRRRRCPGNRAPSP
jgi:hypothetical protein